MGVADELSKLNELKVKGVLTQAEFDKQKSALLSSSSSGRGGFGIWWKTSIGIVAVAGIVITVVALSGGPTLPKCDSEAAKATLSQAFNQSQFAKALNLSAIEISTATEKSFDEKTNTRMCLGVVSMNNTKTVDVNFKLVGRADGKYMLSFEVVNRDEETKEGKGALSPVPEEKPLAKAVLYNSLAVEDEKTMHTRFGVLKVSDENTLLHDDKPIKPDIQGNSSLSLIRYFQSELSDLVLIQDTGGTACPAQFYLLTLSSASVSATEPFGTCNDLIEIEVKGDVVSIAMPGFLGPFEPPAAQRRAEKEKHVFQYRAGMIVEEGRSGK